MSPKILSGAIHREIKINKGVCDITMQFMCIVYAMMRPKKSDK